MNATTQRHRHEIKYLKKRGSKCTKLLPFVTFTIKTIADNNDVRFKISKYFFTRGDYD